MFFLVSVLTFFATSTLVATSYYFKKNSNKVEQLKIKVAWYGLKTYCFLDSLLTQFSRPFRQLQKYSSVEPECIIFVRKNGDEIVRHTETAFRQMRSTLIKGMDYDFIVYEFAGNKEDKYEKYVLFFDEHTKVSNNFKVNSTMKLLGLSVKIQINEEDYYKISLSYGRDNYFIVGNKLLGPAFLNWFFKGAATTIKNNEKYSPYIQEDTKYTVSFIDQKMLCIELSEKQYIVINEEGYTICASEAAAASEESGYEAESEDLEEYVEIMEETML